MRIAIGLMVALGGCAGGARDLDALVLEFEREVDMLDRTCAADSDCALASKELPCAESCRVAIRGDQQDELDVLRARYATRCDGLPRSSGDCAAQPDVARCRLGVCRAESAGASP